MRYRKIGKTDIEVSEISPGCWTLGGDADSGGMGWHAPEEKDAVEAIQYALDKGVNHFDNADVYGAGKAEKTLAKALGNKNKDVVISSKAGWYKGEHEHAYKAENIRAQCEQSLKNLNRDYLDIYYFHNCDFGKDDRYLEEGLAEMRKLQKEGKIRALGLSGYSADDFLRLLPVINPDVLQSWANMLDSRFIDPDKPAAKILKEKGITFIGFNVLGRGLLLDKFSSKNPPSFDSGDIRSTMDEFKKENLEETEAKLSKIKEKFGGTKESLVRAALQYVLYFEVVSCVLAGFRNKEQVEENLSAAGKALSQEEFDYIKEVFR